MPDIKTALTTALEEGKRKFLQSTITDWDEHEKEIRTQPQTNQEKTVQQPAFQFTGNISRDAFNYIKANAGSVTGGDVHRAFMKDTDVKVNSITSITSQLVRNGLVKRHEDGTLSPLIPEYTSIAGAKKVNLKTRGKAKAKPVKKPEKANTIIVSAGNGIAALNAKAPASALPVSIPSLPTAESVLNNISIMEARKLYDELKKLFS